MATNSTEKLIVELAANLAPVNRLPSISVRAAQWSAVAIAVAAAGVWGLGLRRNIGQAVGTPIVLWSVGLALIASASAVMGALRLSIPGRDHSRWMRWLPFAAVAAWAAMLVTVARASGVSSSALLHERFHSACVIEVLALSVVLGLFLLRDIRRAAALDAAFTAALIALGSSAFAAMTVQLICPIDRPAHLLISHVLPAVAFVAVGVTCCRSYLRQ